MSGCGRVGFEQSPDAVTDTADLGSETVSEPDTVSSDSAEVFDSGTGGADTPLDTVTEASLDTVADFKTETLDPETETLDSGTDTDSASGTDSDTATDTSTVCPALAGRLTVSDITVAADIQYGFTGYNFLSKYAGVVADVHESGAIFIAFKEQGRDVVHVMPVTDDLQQAGPDTEVAALDVIDMVAQIDGVALLVRLVDTGDNVAVDTAETPQKAVALTRIQNGITTFTTLLTGCDGVDGELDYNNTSDPGGRLAWNGSFYGAYFVVRGGVGHPDEGVYSDKLVYLNDSGTQVGGGIYFACGGNQGLDLLATHPTWFTALCLAESTPNPGLNTVDKFASSSHWLSPEETSGGYVGATMGNAVTMSDGSYAVAWLSRGWNAGTGAAAHDDRDIVLLHLDDSLAPTHTPQVLARTPDVEELALHMVPYGSNGVLLLWDEVTNLTCSSGACFGTFQSTRVQLLTWSGTTWQGAPSVSLAVGSPADRKLAKAPNGDILFAYIEDTPDYSTPNPSRIFPGRNTIHVARIRYCTQ